MADRSVAGEFYEFRVKDHLEDGWFRMFDGLSVQELANEEVLISGRLIDQSALYEVLERIQSLNLVLISIVRVEQPAE
jgi:hypothetical protein